MKKLTTIQESLLSVLYCTRDLSEYDDLYDQLEDVLSALEDRTFDHKNQEVINLIEILEDVLNNGFEGEEVCDIDPMPAAQLIKSINLGH